MKKYLFTIIILILVLTGAGFYLWDEERVTVNGEEEIIVKDTIPPKPKYNIKTHVVTENDIFATIVEDWGIGYSEMLELLDMTSSTYDLTRIRIGQPLRIARGKAGNIAYLEYEVNSEEYVHVDWTADGYEAKMREIEYEIEIIKQSATVSSSLYIDGLHAGIPEEIIMQFADTFAWTIDFSVQVKKGDRFTLVYEKRKRNGKDAGTGKLLTGKFFNIGKEYNAYVFKDAEGNLTYYNSDGESLQKQFLRAPLNYRHISSGYTYARFDPINGRKGEHRAIDYAAALGTPIMAVGDGTIRFAGWNRQGFGNFVSIRHNDTYITEYAHMLGFAKGIRKGVHVTQGQVIGYVGSTGHSTGPHLHYQIKYNGVLVNPLEIELPAGDPVPDDMRDEFEKVKNRLEKYYK